MTDHRFPTPGADLRHPVPERDWEHDTFPVDQRFPAQGTDQRFDASEGYGAPVLLHNWDGSLPETLTLDGIHIAEWHDRIGGIPLIGDVAGSTAPEIATRTWSDLEVAYFSGADFLTADMSAVTLPDNLGIIVVYEDIPVSQYSGTLVMSFSSGGQREILMGPNSSQGVIGRHTASGAVQTADTWERGEQVRALFRSGADVQLKRRGAAWSAAAVATDMAGTVGDFWVGNNNGPNFLDGVISEVGIYSNATQAGLEAEMTRLAAKWSIV